MGCCEAVLSGKFIAIQAFLKKEERSQIDNPLARLTKKRRARTQITKIINEKGEITKNHKRIL